VLHNTLAAPPPPPTEGLWQSAYAQGYDKGYGKGLADGKRLAIEADVADAASDVASTRGKSKKKKTTGENKKWETEFKEKYPEQADLKNPNVYECYCGESEGWISYPEAIQKQLRTLMAEVINEETPKTIVYDQLWGWLYDLTLYPPQHSELTEAADELDCPEMVGIQMPNRDTQSTGKKNKRRAIRMRKRQ